MNALLVFVGGGLGSLARWGTNAWLGAPLATLVVNWIGSFVIGFLLARYEQPALISLLVVGFLGGFTTFSGFSIDFIRLGPSQVGAYLYLLASVIGAILLCWLGTWLSVRV